MIALAVNIFSFVGSKFPSTSFGITPETTAEGKAVFEIKAEEKN